MEDAQMLAELYELVKQNKKEQYSQIIEEKASYPYLYHLSPMRENLIDWFPLRQGARILERNAECGALTGKLLEKASEVTSVTESGTALKILEMRYQEAEGGQLILCSEEDTRWKNREGAYDLILIAGNFYRYCGELKDLKRLLKKDGRLVVADANRIGLKYFAGCQEEYQGGYFTGVEGYHEQDTAAGRSYTRKEYECMLGAAGFGKLEFYYPYPDYKFPSCIYSDSWLPGKGELSDNRRNFDRDRYQLFDERQVFDTLLAEGLFYEFANSFLIEAAAQEA